MIELDVADLVVITGQVLGTGADTALGRLGQLTPDGAASWLATRLSRHPEAPASEEPRRAARRVMLAPVAALRRRHHRRSRPGPVLISLGSADKPAGIRSI